MSPRTSRCYAYGRHGVTCGGRLHDHHLVKQQHIRLVHRSLVAAHRRGGPPPPWRLHVALKDRRLQRKACVNHHALERTARLEVFDTDLPEGFWDAVAEYGLHQYVPKNLTPPEEETMATCKSCGAEIKWARTASGRRMPLDADERGNIIIENGVLKVVPKDEIGGILAATYTSHFATCPQAKTHRKARS